MAPFKLTFVLEAITLVEFIVPSLRIAVEDKLLPEDSLLYRIKDLATLDEDRLRSFYWSQEIQLRRKQQIDRHSKIKIFENGQLVLVFNTKCWVNSHSCDAPLISLPNSIS